MPKFFLSGILLFIFSVSGFAQAPANDNCTGATVLSIQNGTCTTPIAGTTVNATKSTQTGFIPFATDDDVWYKFTTPAGAPEVRFNVLVQLSDIVFTGTPSDIFLERRDGASEICNDFFLQFQSLSTTGSFGWLMTGLLPSTQYSIRLYTDGDAARVAYKICLTLPPPPANDECGSAIELSPALDACVPAGPFNTLTATKSPQPSGDFLGSDDDVWFKFTTDNAPMNYSAELKLLSPPQSSYNTGFGNPAIELWDSCGNPAPQPWAAKMFFPFSTTGVFGALTPNTTYFIRIYTYGTTSRFTQFNICVKKVVPPANDECTNSVNLTVGPIGVFAPAVQGTTRFATQSSQPEAPCFTMPDDDVWYRFTAPASGVVGLKMDNITNPDGFGTPIMAAMLYSGECNTLVNRACLSANEGLFSGLTPGQVYVLRVMTNDGGMAANFGIALRELVPPANDLCANAFTIPVNTDGTYTLFTSGTTNLAGTSSTPVAPCTPMAANDVWYRFTAPEGGAVQMQLFNVINPQGGSTSMYAILYNGNCATPVHMQCINSNMAVFSGLLTGAEYLVRVMSNSPGQMVIFSLGMRVLLPMQDNGSCTNVRTLNTTRQRGTTLGLPMSNTTVACYGSVAPNKVLYYQFVATAASHYIDFARFFNLSLNSNGIGFRVYKAPCTGDIVARTIKCISSVSFANELIPGLTIGDTYIVQVMENTFNGGPMEFDIRLAPPGAAIWKGGGGNNKFSNPANWMNNQVPDENTDVIIPGGKPAVMVAENVAIRSLKIDPGARLDTAPGVIISVRE